MTASFIHSASQYIIHRGAVMGRGQFPCQKERRKAWQSVARSLAFALLCVCVACKTFWAFAIAENRVTRGAPEEGINNKPPASPLLPTPLKAKHVTYSGIHPGNNQCGRRRRQSSATPSAVVSGWQSTLRLLLGLLWSERAREGGSEGGIVSS